MSTTKPHPVQSEFFSTEAESELEHVHKVYDQIALHFSETRYKGWPVVEEFLNSHPSGSLGGDIGCGNGKYLGYKKDIVMLGSDRCENLIKVVNSKGHEGLIADNLKLPYRNNQFDFAISIAVIHHFSTPQRRAEAIKEILRTIRVGGDVLLYVWALEQKSRRKFDQNQQDVYVPWVMQSQFETNKPSKAEETKVNNEEKEEEKKPNKVYNRYYHLFKEGELEELVNQVENTEIVKSGYDRDNWYCIVKKN
ncbi:S-adenosyl-L-methionine-dependent methyltransferase [Conidiobolus coronatus NRRL 28638]|uniref:S-adenosyl-L-methionine-dependent methyltransferase n=1 Tax=Conidiobolus coronatus (strain ATCC 28846 / CBS 209.66 / NRRL 28638) TaxID=796925 RepID=A0A137NRW0_CONC2|nr:S-adenosyl-L-methionine-dependent methyltransferase [Conidiobolus coronatus NRRL 28638]|eukprot:KXN65503.1 S-adenosyl-L-methionine-dependent methyltransferase [Conidiobolus coronatus NRRL 28638]